MALTNTISREATGCRGKERIAGMIGLFVAQLETSLERVMNSAGKPHRNANISVSSVLRRSPVFRISKLFLSKFITASRLSPEMRLNPISTPTT